MLQAGGNPDLAEEPVGANRGGELGAKHLDGDRPIMSGVMRQVHSSHAPLADKALDGIAPLELDTQPVEHISHGVPSEGRTFGR
jgi:hypothetical protein